MPNSELNKRTEAILDVIMSYARLDFDKKLDVGVDNDVLAAIGTGVNMLGEELKVNAVSLKEKEHLLMELHHRVKNNMQIIISMLNLQMMNEKDQRLINVVEDCKSRIKAMSLAHEMLYSTDGFEFSQFSEYVDYLTRSVFLSYASPDHQIDLELEISKDIYFNIDRMIPAGLIINEFLSNSLKHAFPENKGIIRIKAELSGDTCLLCYEDNGVGLPSGFEVKESESLGLQLIFLLSEQLGGDLTYNNGQGLSYSLEF